MKVIIVEGMDNTGKSTIIEQIVDFLANTNNIDRNRIFVKHLDKPDGSTNIDKISNIDITNYNLATFLLKAKKKQLYDYIILDRSWYSEYVYGQIYRHRSEEDVYNKIKVLENIVSDFFIGYGYGISILIFLSTNIDFFINYEDGNSLSIGDNQKELIIKEKQSFTDIAYKSSMQRHIDFIIVNNGEKFRPKDEIFDEVKKIINNY